MDMTLYCPQCGKAMLVADEDGMQALECPHCQHVFRPRMHLTQVGPSPDRLVPDLEQPGKSKLVAGLLGIFFGALGFHRFYLGYPGIGTLQILVTVMGCVTCMPGCLPIPLPFGHIWGFTEGVLCFMGKMTDADGRPLVD